MELKYIIGTKKDYQKAGSNCTFMELKCSDRTLNLLQR